VEAHMRVLWCLHGEALALQLAGSEAVYADLVRGARPSLSGVLDDVTMRLCRWVPEGGPHPAGPQGGRAATLLSAVRPGASEQTVGGKDCGALLLFQPEAFGAPH
jgi:hypothetical protein